MANRIRKVDANQGQRILATISSERPDEQHPTFSFEYLEDCDLRHIDKKHLVSLIGTMQMLGQMTWQQIKQSPRHGLGFEKISQNAIRRGLPSSVTPDTILIAFRFSGKAPMVGFRREATFFVVWLDHDFSLYKH